MENNNNINMRNRRARRCFSNGSVDSLDTSCLNLSVRSMMDLSTHVKNDEVLELHNLIENLRGQLLSAHTEIEKLNLDNSMLKQNLEEEIQKNERLKRMYTSFSTNLSARKVNIPSNDNITKESKNTSMIIKSKLSARKLNLDLEFHTPKSSTQLHLSAKSCNNRIDEDKPCKNNCSLDCNGNSNSQDLNSPRKPAPAVIAQKAKETNKEKGRILLLSDNQGRGIIKDLLKNKNQFVLQDYNIQSITKPNAKSKYVLAECRNMAEFLSK